MQSHKLEKPYKKKGNAKSRAPGPALPGFKALDDSILAKDDVHMRVMNRREYEQASFRTGQPVIMPEMRPATQDASGIWRVATLHEIAGHVLACQVVSGYSSSTLPFDKVVDESEKALVGFAQLKDRQGNPVLAPQRAVRSFVQAVERLFSQLYDEDMPWQLWTSAVDHYAGDFLRMPPFRGLVLADRDELSFCAQPDYLGLFIVVLDLSKTDFDDAAASDLKTAVGPILGALRLDETKITGEGIGHLARAVGDGCGSYTRLQYLSLRRQHTIRDADNTHLAKFPSLAALDLRGTNVSTHLLQPKVKERHGHRSLYHVATVAEAAVFAAPMSLTDTYARLQKMLQPEKDTLPGLVHISQMTCDHVVPSIAKQTSKGVVYTPEFGQVYCQKIDAALLNEDSEQARGGNAAFRVNSGGMKASSESSAPRALPRKIRKAPGVNAKGVDSKPLHGPQVPQQDARLLFRYVRLDTSHPAPPVPAPQPKLERAATVPINRKRPSDEPVNARKKSTSDVLSLLAAKPAPKALLRPSPPVPKPLAATNGNVGPLSGGSSSSGMKAQRQGLSAFKKSSVGRFG